MWYIVPLEVLQNRLDKGKSVRIWSFSLDGEEIFGRNEEVGICRHKMM
jgi:hypothetical protein